MKKLMMICALVFSVITYANAQKGGGSPEDRAKKMVDQMAEKLKLNDDQKTKVSAIYMEQGEAMKKIRDEAGDDKAAAREKSTKLRQENDAKINALLTDDQKVAFKAMQDEQKAKMKNGQGGGQGGKGGEKKENK